MNEKVLFDKSCRNLSGRRLRHARKSLRVVSADISLKGAVGSYRARLD